LSATKLKENFTLGITDPAFNSPCVDADGVPVGNPALLTPAPPEPEASLLHIRDRYSHAPPFAVHEADGEGSIVDDHLEEPPR
jgi:hypothetical protein